MASPTCTISKVDANNGIIEPVYIDLAQGRAWLQIVREAIACEAVTESGLYLLTTSDPTTKVTTSSLILTIKIHPPEGKLSRRVVTQFGIHLDQTVNVTRWPPKTN